MGKILAAVYTSGVVARVLVDCSAASDKRVHVCHGYADLGFAFRQGFRDSELIQIEGVIVVNGSPRRSVRSFVLPSASAGIEYFRLRQAPLSKNRGASLSLSLLVGQYP